MTDDITASLAALDWPRIEADLHERGACLAGPVLAPKICAELAALYEDPARFRKRVVMERISFGRGEYQYFGAPLPEPVAHLRTALYGRLVGIANLWAERLGLEERYPARHADYLDRCRRAGQDKPTPLLLRYREGDYNRLHQDVYGDLVFPLQVVVQLSRPRRDFEGGQFVVTEQRPRTQSRAEVFDPEQGEAVIFAVRHRPGRGARGWHRLTLRHGVATLRAGARTTLGMIFHDAR